MNSEQFDCKSPRVDSSTTTDLVREAERLLGEHGDKADVVAARLADASFSTGDRAGGFRWSKIFVILAVAHIRSVCAARAQV